MGVLERMEAVRQQTDRQLTTRSLEIYEELSAMSPLAKELAGELSDIHVEQLVRAEDKAVRQHGRQILAAIEGTTWVSDGDQLIGITEDDSRLVQLVDGAGRVAS